LLDPIRKTNLDASLRVKLARKERFAKFDAKRKGMQDELEEAERAVKKAKMDKAKEERERREEAERIKEEGRRMRQERENEIKGNEEGQGSRDREAAKAFKLGQYFQCPVSAGLIEPIAGPLDTTVRVRYPLSAHPTLTTPSSLATLLSSFGSIDVSSIVISMKPSKKAPHKPPKFVTALVPFAQIGDAHAAVCASGVEARGLKTIEISWAEGKEPKVLDALQQTHQLDPAGGHSEVSSSASSPFIASSRAAASRASATFSAPSFVRT
jgi:DnaJ homolog subfamily C member 17